MQLHIIGTGIKRPMQLTLEGLRALQQADKVLHLTGTAEPMEALFRELGVTQPLALDSLYEHGGIDGVNYARLADAVVAHVQSNERVALLIYGHPRVGVSLTSILEERLGGIVSVIPAPSSFDTMINDLRRDPLHRGSVLLDANRVLLFEPTLDPTIDCYIFHVDSVATRKTANGDERHGRRDLLQAYLRRFYPAEHLVTIVASAVGDEPAATVEVPLSDFEAAAELMSQGATLFLPAMRPRSLNHAVRDMLLASVQGA